MNIKALFIGLSCSILFFSQITLASEQDAECSSVFTDSSKIITNKVLNIVADEENVHVFKEDGTMVHWTKDDSSKAVDEALEDIADVVTFSVGVKVPFSKVMSDIMFKGEVGDLFFDLPLYLTGIVKKYEGDARIVAVLKKDGSVHLIGDKIPKNYSSIVSKQLQSGVVAIYASSGSLIAVKDDSSAVVLGNRLIQPELRRGVVDVVTNEGAVAIRKDDGSVVVFGSSMYGGFPPMKIRKQLKSGVVKVIATRAGFAALKDDGSVISWGSGEIGSTYEIPFDSVADKLKSGVVEIIANDGAFLAIKDDGSVVVWGSMEYIGNWDDLEDELQSGVVEAVASRGAFAIRKDNGSVITLGSISRKNWKVTSEKLKSGVVEILANDDGFFAKKDDSSAIAWGNSFLTKDYMRVAKELESGVISIYANRGSFVAFKKDAQIVSLRGSTVNKDASLFMNGKTVKLSDDVGFFSNKTGSLILRVDGSFKINVNEVGSVDFNRNRELSPLIISPYRYFFITK